MTFRKSSFDQDPMEATGSFTGTFEGDATSLTAGSASDVAYDDVRDKPALVSSSAQLTGQIDVTGVSGSFTGSFIGDSSGTFTGSFTGTLDGQAATALGFTESFDAVNIEDEGRWRQKTIIPSVKRTSLGLIFRDQFNRADSPNLENDWVHSNISQSISDNKFQHETGGPGAFAFFTGSTTANRFPTTGSLNLPAKYMVQGNVSMGGTAVGNFDITTRENTDDRTGPTGRYQAQIYHNSLAVRRIMKFYTSSNEVLASSAFNAASGAFYGERLILEDLGDSTLAVSGAWTLELSSSADLQAPFTAENLSALDTAITQSETNIIGFANQVGAALDEYIIQGVEVLVTGLPSGFKAGIDGDTSVVESNRTATINVRTRALPFATISIFDTDDVVQAQVIVESASLSDGWGGDTYAYDEQEYQFIPISGSGEEELVALAIRRDGTTVGTFEGDFTGSNSFTGSLTGGVAVLTSGSGKEWGRSTGSDAGGSFNALDFTLAEFGSRFGALVDELLVFVPPPIIPPPLFLPQTGSLQLYYDARVQTTASVIREIQNNLDMTRVPGGDFSYTASPPSIALSAGIDAQRNSVPTSRIRANSDGIQTMMILMKPSSLDGPYVIDYGSNGNDILLGSVSGQWEWFAGAGEHSGDDPRTDTIMPATASVWQTVCYSIDVDGANKQKGYLNGVQRFTLNKTFNLTQAQGNLAIGHVTGLADYTGEFGAYLHWTVTLTPAEVAEAHNFLRAIDAGYGLPEA